MIYIELFLSAFFTIAVFTSLFPNFIERIIGQSFLVSLCLAIALTFVYISIFFGVKRYSKKAISKKTDQNTPVARHGDSFNMFLKWGIIASIIGIVLSSGFLLLSWGCIGGSSLFLSVLTLFTLLFVRQAMLIYWYDKELELNNGIKTPRTSELFLLVFTGAILAVLMGGFVVTFGTVGSTCAFH